VARWTRECRWPCIGCYSGRGQTHCGDGRALHRQLSRRAFAASGIDLKGLAGKHVRVRGWIEWRNGPMVAATHPEQLELLPAATPAL